VSLWRRARRERLVAEPPVGADPRAAQDDPDQALERALALLPRRQRAVVVLRYYADLSEKDVAGALGCAVGTVKIHNARAMARLRELLPRPEYRSEGVRR
jgi:RNA polymerase sigma factor (sigma-70 family)